MSVDTRSDYTAKIKTIVCDVLEIDEDELRPDASFRDDYGADSLQAIEILAELEKAFGIVIEQSELSRMGTLNGVTDVVAETAGWR